MHDHRRLVVWAKARSLAGDVYRLTKRFPPSERFGLTSQMRRAAVSVAADIAEGAGRGGNREFARYLRIAQGSLSELDTLVLIAHDVGAISGDAALSLETTVKELRAMLRSLEAHFAK